MRFLAKHVLGIIKFILIGLHNAIMQLTGKKNDYIASLRFMFHRKIFFTTSGDLIICYFNITGKHTYVRAYSVRRYNMRHAEIFTFIPLGKVK